MAPSPNIENLRKQAKTLLRAWKEGNAEAQNRVSAIYSKPRHVGLQDVQHVLAREYGFRSWSALTRFVPRMGYFDDIATFRIEREFDVSLERLWAAISKPDEIGTWLLPVSFETLVGAPYSFRSHPAMTGTLGVYSERRAIRFDSGEDAFWLFAIQPIESDASRILLSVKDKMTLNSVEQFPGGATKVWNPGVTAGWHEILDELEFHLTGRKPPVVDYSRLCRFYDRVLAQLTD